MLKKIKMSKYKLKRHELGELRALKQLIREEDYKHALVRDNTAVVHNGKEYEKTLKSVIVLLGSAFENALSKIAHANGITGKIELDLERGIIFEVKDD